MEDKKCCICNETDDLYIYEGEIYCVDCLLEMLNITEITFLRDGKGNIFESEEEALKHFGAKPYGE